MQIFPLVEAKVNEPKELSLLTVALRAFPFDERVISEKPSPLRARVKLKAPIVKLKLV